MDGFVYLDNRNWIFMYYNLQLLNFEFPVMTRYLIYKKYLINESSDFDATFYIIAHQAKS